MWLYKHNKFNKVKYTVYIFITKMLIERVNWLLYVTTAHTPEKYKLQTLGKEVWNVINFILLLKCKLKQLSYKNTWP